MLEPEIVLETEELVVVNKPPGFLVHRTKMDKLENRVLLQYVRDLTGTKLYPVNRLDKATSGLCLFAKSAELVRSYQSLWEESLILKKYYALCRGWWAGPMTINRPLEQIKKESERTSKAQGEKKEATTKLTPIQNFSLEIEMGNFSSQRYSLIDIDLVTGRRHQIRRHTSGENHPIIGDTTHGDRAHNRLFEERFESHGLLLQSYLLSFTDPNSKEHVALELALDPRIDRVVQGFNPM